MVAKAEARRYWARRPMGYAGKQLDRGQVFTAAGEINDEKLERLGFMVPLEKTAAVFECAQCGSEFTGEPERRGHGDRRHRTEPLTPLEEDQIADRDERFLSQAAPLYLENSAAARS